MNRTCFTLIILAVIGLFSSCHHKEFCYNHPHDAKLRIDVDWSKFEPYETPTGMTLKIYPKVQVPDQEGVQTYLTNTTSHAIVDLKPNRYHVLVFNQSTTEFGTFSFNNLDDEESAVVVMQYESRWYRSRAGEHEVANDVEWLGVGNEDDVVVTEEMVNSGETHDHYNGSSRNDDNYYVIAKVTPRNVIYTVKVRIHINNIYNLRSARGALTGMSEGYLLTRELRLNSEVTHLMEKWSLKHDDADATKGYVEASFTCFGLPQDHAASPEENLLTFNALLVDNETIKPFEFNVGNRFELDPSDPNRMTYLIVIDEPITLEDVEPAEGSGWGFKVTVDDWGDEDDYNINM